MDLSLIQTHLDNFVTTWEGWGKVVTGLKGIFGYGEQDGLGKEDFAGLSSAFEVFSSKPE